MTTRSALTLALLLFSTACPDRFDAADSSESTTGGVATSDATQDTGGNGTSDDTQRCGCPEIGIAECDHYIVEYCACLLAHAPEATRQAMLDAFSNTCETWMEAAQGPDAERLAQGCGAALGAVQQTAAGWGCAIDPLPGSCAGYCGTEMEIPNGDVACYCDADCETRKDCCADFVDLCSVSEVGSCDGNCGSNEAIPDGPNECFCDADCETYKDCCYDFYDICGAKGLAPDDGAEVVEAHEPGPDAPALIDTSFAISRWPSAAAYPEIPAALLHGLASAKPVAVLAGLEAAFAGPEWPTERRWNRFGAIDLDVDASFVSLEGTAMMPLHRVSLGCLGGFIEAVRLLEAPTLGLDTVLAPAVGCPLTHSSGAQPCTDGDHTGLHVLLNLRDAYLPAWTVDLVQPDDLETLKDALRPSSEPYYVSASHLGRGSSKRHYHHMMVIVVEPDAALKGPIVFDTTGRRGVSVRRVPWSTLSRYLGIVLAGSSRFPYVPGTNEIAVLHSGPAD